MSFNNLPYYVAMHDVFNYFSLYTIYDICTVLYHTATMSCTRTAYTIGVILYNLNMSTGKVTQIGNVTHRVETNVVNSATSVSSDSNFTILTFGVNNGRLTLFYDSYVIL
jgi:hypothetical protein